MSEILATILATLARLTKQVWGTVSQVVFTELEFMAQHPAATLVAVVVLGLLAFLGYRVAAR